MLCSKQHFRCNKFEYSSSPFCKCLLVFQTIDTFFKFFLFIQLCKGILRRAELIQQIIFLIIILHFCARGSETFLKTICNLSLIVSGTFIIICHYASSSQEVEKPKNQDIYLKRSSLCFKATNTTSWPGHGWSLAKRSRKRCYVGSSFPIVQLGVRCVFQL